MWFARHAVDANRLGLQSQTEIVNQAGNARILDARIGLELVSRHHRTRADELDLASDVEFAALLSQTRGHVQQFIVGLFATHLRFVQKFDRRQLIIGKRPG